MMVYIVLRYIFNDGEDMVFVDNVYAVEDAAVSYARIKNAQTNKLITTYKVIQRKVK